MESVFSFRNSAVLLADEISLEKTAQAITAPFENAALIAVKSLSARSTVPSGRSSTFSQAIETTQ